MGDIRIDDGLILKDPDAFKLIGQATMWDDIVNSLIGRQLQSTAGKVDYNWADNCITFESGGSISNLNDIVNWNQQFPHAARKDSSIYPHIHLEQTSTNKIIYTLKYRIQVNGAAKTTDWQTVTCNTTDNAVFPYVSGTINQIIAFPAISMLNAGLSATVQFQMTRTDSTAGDSNVTFVDCHVEYDSLGSRQAYVK